MRTDPVILVIEDEAQIRRFLRANLNGHGYTLYEAATGQDGLRQASMQQPDVVLLDLGLPDVDGLEVTRRLREWGSMPIIVLSARGQEQDKIAALDAGADDYLTKPFGVGELQARLRVALRHTTRIPATSEPILSTGDLQIDLAQRQVLLRGEVIHLTPLEYKLLAFLARHAGKLVTQRQLLHEVWGPAYTTETHYLRVYMAQLRHKLEDDPARPRYLITEPSVGYRLQIED